MGDGVMGLWNWIRGLKVPMPGRCLGHMGDPVKPVVIVIWQGRGEFVCKLDGQWVTFKLAQTSGLLPLREPEIDVVNTTVDYVLVHEGVA